MTRKIFDHWAGKPLQQMMSDICQRCNNLMIWIRPDIKKALETHFSIDEGFKLHRLTKVANRASPRSSSYTSGSATFMKTKSRLSKSLDRKSTLVETFKYTHTLKANKERFSDERLEATTQQSQPPSEDDVTGTETSVVDPDRVCHKTTSKPHKNCRFELGSFLASGIRSSALAASSTSATSPADPQKVVDWREEVQKLTQKLRQ
ncbi:hypothetical protein Ahy_B05g077939 [Arachis hypogaea]|uniref:Uncharacterized protein n=1 Tax=Arachis hypogaea TaxID=3818 RepID=A0A444Z5X4_ARAHY|nr:hypothetical protein Ahy_B05g077939 [Arachis hypogaea]